MRILYEADSPDGQCPLTDQNWYDLERAGWEVGWYKNYKNQVLIKNGRFLGDLADHAFRCDLSLEDAIHEWETVTGLDADNESNTPYGTLHCFTELE